MIAEIIPRNDFELYVTLDDGTTGIFDVKPFLHSEVFAPLQNPGEFKRVRNGRYFVSWACGADLSADTILARLKPTRVTPRKQPAKTFQV